MRKVTIFKWEKAKNQLFSEKVSLGAGVFHGWGSDYEEFETGAGNYSTAIIEMEDGTIQNPHVEMIKFEDVVVAKIEPVDNEHI